MYNLTELTDFLATEFKTNRYPEPEQGGIYHKSDRPVARLGLALEPFPAYVTGLKPPGSMRSGYTVPGNSTLLRFPLTWVC